MASSLRELRQRRNSVATTKKITRAMELIAASRIVKAQQAVRSSLPYSDSLVHAVSALANYSHVLEHPFLRDVEPPRRSAVLIITGDRGTGWSLLGQRDPARGAAHGAECGVRGRNACSM